MHKKAIRVLVTTTILLMLTAITSISAFAASIPTSSGPSSRKTATTINPYSPAYQHTYRHGVLPTRVQSSKVKAYQRTHPAAAGSLLSFGGGIDGIGVTSGKEKVYLVFWGTQWGTQSTDSSGNLTFSNDTAGGAPQMQNLFNGLGTGNELWSGTMTQYCDGAGVSAGATSCAAGTAHVGYPTGGALAGVWYDNSAAEPNTANGFQLATEAITAAAHFGNTTASSNRYAQYVILSASGTNPDSYQSNGFCAWHDYNGDSSLGGGSPNSPYGDIAFTNMPYVMNVGTSCGQNFVNSGSAGTLDGYTIVEGHEYAETVTDQNPAGGWTSSSSGQENGDECAWISPGSAGGAGNVAMSTGSFPMQATWSNDTNSCNLSHAIVEPPAPNDFTVSGSPTSLSVIQGQNSTSTISTLLTNGAASTASLSASVSPSGPTISLSPTSVTIGDSSTLTVGVESSVTPGTTYTVTVTATEGDVSHTTSVSILVISAMGGVSNGDFETGTLAGWTTAGTTSISTTAHTGSASGQAGGTSPTSGDSSISQTFLVPDGLTTLTFWYRVTCPDTLTYDWATATLQDSASSTTSTILAKVCTNNSTWVNVTASVTAGHVYTLTLISHDDNYPADPTYTLFDDVALS